MGTPWAAICSASASMVHRVVPSEGSSVTSFTKKQHVVVVIDTRETAALEVVEAGEPELVVTLSPHADLVVVQVDGEKDMGGVDGL